MGFFSKLNPFKASSDRSPWGDFWFGPAPMRTGAGGLVSADAAMQLAAVYSCVRVLTETMASLPLVVYKRRADGGKDRVTDHWLAKLLCKRPNAYQNPFEWREMLQGHLALRGNAYCQIISNSRGVITELMPIHPDRVSIEVMDGGDYRYIVKKSDGSEQIFTRGSIWHLRGLSSDGIIGLSPIAAARSSLGAALAAQDYGNRFFSNDAKPTGGWIEFPGSFKDHAAKQAFRDSYQKQQGGANRGKVLVLENDMKYHEIGMNNKDSQFLETRKYQATDIARIFRVPPHLIGDLDRATFSNIEQQSLEFIIHTMTPWAMRWESSIEFELSPEDAGLEFAFDFTSLMRGDADSRAKYYGSGISNGWMTRNEARIAENLNPLPGLNEPLRPLNMVEESDAEDGEASTPNPKKQQEVDPGEDTNALRMRVMVQQNAARLARRYAKQGIFTVADADVVAASLAIDSCEVNKWAGHGIDFNESALEAAFTRLGTF
jgi:HK97 family phage portal protein